MSIYSIRKGEDASIGKWNAEYLSQPKSYSREEEWEEEEETLGGNSYQFLRSRYIYIYIIKEIYFVYSRTHKPAYSEEICGKSTAPKRQGQPVTS